MQHGVLRPLAHLVPVNRFALTLEVSTAETICTQTVDL